MTGITDLCHPETVRVAAAHQAEAEKIAAELAAIAATGMVLPGSITQRRTRCGRRNCGCHADPPRLHGPYWQWTRKIAAKTICRWLTADQHDDYQRPGSTTTGGCTNCSPGWKPSAPPPSKPTPAGNARHAWPAQPEPKPPDSVGSARLTCGQPSSQPRSRSVSPKREDLTTSEAISQPSHLR